MHDLRLLAATLAFILAAPLAHANLVKNGDFENTPDHTLYWTYFSPDGLSLFGPDFSQPGSTNYAFHDGSYTGLGTLSQAIATITGAKYTLTFDVLRGHDPSQGGLDNLFEADFGGQVLVTETDVVSGWTTYTFKDLVAAGNLTTLLFTNFNFSSYNELDNISLVLQDPGDPGEVPEPGSLALLLIGAAAVAHLRRRNQR